MRQVSYTGRTFVTTDEMAAALVEFAATIATNAASEATRVPALDDHWKPISVDLVVGPSSELISVPFDGGDNDLDTSEAARVLVERTKELKSRGEGRPDALPLDEPLPSAGEEE